MGKVKPKLSKSRSAPPPRIKKYSSINCAGCGVNHSNEICPYCGRRRIKIEYKQVVSTSAESCIIDSNLVINRKPNMQYKYY